MKPTFFQISIDLFGDSAVTVFVNHDGKRLRSVYRRWKSSPSQMKAIEHGAAFWDRHACGAFKSGCTLTTPEGPVVLLLLDGSDHSLIVAHEMVHAAWRVMNNVAIECNSHTEEILAYLVGFLTSKTLRGIDRHARTKKRK